MGIQLKLNLAGKVQTLNFKTPAEVQSYVKANNIQKSQIVEAQGFNMESIVFTATATGSAVKASANIGGTLSVLTDLDVDAAVSPSLAKVATDENHD